jgi:hypothetical protein
MGEKNTDEQGIDRLLSKYVLVWLWSILFGASTGLSYSFMAYRPYDSWGSMGFLLVALLAVGILCTCWSWLFLFRYLTRYLVPKFFAPDETGERGKLRYPPAVLLKRAFLLMIVAVLARLSLQLVELLYLSLQW